VVRGVRSDGCAIDDGLPGKAIKLFIEPQQFAAEFALRRSGRAAGGGEEGKLGELR
jgi:hypothetical protein